MTFKLVQGGQQRWRSLSGPHLAALFGAGAKFDKGVLMNNRTSRSRKPPGTQRGSDPQVLDDSWDVGVGPRSMTGRASLTDVGADVTGALHLLYGAAKNRLSPPFRRRLLYARAHKWPPRLNPPVTFTEKVTWRMLNDRRPLIGQMGDKLRMKQYAVEVAPNIVKVPETLWQGTDVALLTTVGLPEYWVLKPNHSSKRVYFGRGAPDVTELRQFTADWLDEPLSRAGEWAYSQASRLLFAEALLGVPGKPPQDYKFFVFAGEPKVIQVDSDRYVGHRRSLYTPEWQRLRVRTPFPEPYADESRPELLDRMLVAASRLGQPFDFIRVDLYTVDGEIYLGELTPYPGGGVQPYRPRSFDAELGSHWNLPTSSHADCT
jgi:hypothetical protein